MTVAYPERHPLIERAAFLSWVVYEDAQLLVINKPGDVVCHPSKNGPLSSLVGAVREFGQLVAAHLIFRLDRETSGVVVFAKDAVTASRLQKAVQARRVTKRYLVILDGILESEVLVDQPLGKDMSSPVWTKDAVSHGDDAKPAQTLYTPLVSRNGFSLVEAKPITGRKHQIRAHAEWLGLRVVGDKMYGPDSSLYVDFVENGWNDRLAAKLPLMRQALHCLEVTFPEYIIPSKFRAPFAPDLGRFCADRMGISLTELSSFG